MFFLLGHYYKMASQKELDMFLLEPEKYVPPFAPRKLPPPELLPTRLTKDKKGDRLPEIRGYCPVTYLDGKLRYITLSLIVLIVFCLMLFFIFRYSIFMAFNKFDKLYLCTLLLCFNNTIDIEVV